MVRLHVIRPEHRRRRWATLFRRKALGDLFQAPYGRSSATGTLELGLRTVMELQGNARLDLEQDGPDER